MAYEAWRVSRIELRDLLNKYEKAVEDDAAGILRPTDAERKALGQELLRIRLEHVRKARDANRQFVEAVVEDLPDLCTPDSELPPRPVMVFREIPDGTPTLPSSSYGSMASVFLHLFRDWSSECHHVYESTYAPVIHELRKLLPQGGEVLVPGAGLARLALALAGEGYKVEANEGSRLFLTFADYVLNRAAPASATIFPLAHVFSETYGHCQQYLSIAVPQPPPAGAAVSSTYLGAELPIVMVPGEFVKIYGRDGPGHRKFNALVTCFFLDTVTDIVELIDVMDGLLEEGGVWVNIGPLNWRKETRLKLNWEEIVALWRSLGYEFVTQSSAETDYHLQRGLKMYTESYKCALVAAVKRSPPTAPGGSSPQQANA